MADLAQYKKLAKELVDNDKDRDEIFRKYRDAWHCDWQLPVQLDPSRIQGIHKVVNTIPHDSIATGVRVLTGKPPALKMTPLLANVETQATANRIERNLKWQLRQANRRRPQPVESDMLQSALTYAAIVAQVIDLDWQIDQMTKMQQDARRWKNLRRYSRFVVPTYHPLDAHVAYSTYMPEAVVIKQERLVRDILMDFPWVEIDSRADAKMCYYEWWDYQYRCAWLEPVEGGKGEIVLMPEMDHELPFLPWIAMMGGSTLESDPQHAYHGMLYPNIMSGKWETVNSMSTMMASEAIWNFARAKYKQESDLGATEGEVAQVDAWNPGRVVEVPPGARLSPMDPNYADPALKTLVETFSGEMQSSMATHILQGGGATAGMAFASLNLLTLTAVGALKPWREVTERALAEMYTQMLLWVDYTQKPLVAYGKDAVGEMGGDANVIMPDDFDPEGIYMEVELVPDLPTNRAAQANTAIMLKQAGLLSDERAMEDLGIEDPQSEQEKLIFDMLTQEEISRTLQMQRMEMEMQMQQDQMDMQQEDQQAAMEQQALEQQLAQQDQMMQGQGDMYAPPQGGQPFATMMPGATRELMTGVDKAGLPLASEEFQT